MAKTLVTTYRGCNIYFLTPPDAAAEVYMSPCITGLYYKRSAVTKRIDIKLTADEAEETVEKTRLELWDEALTALADAERYGERQILIQLYDSELTLDEALTEAYRIIQGVQDEADAQADQAAADAQADAEAAQAETEGIIGNAIDDMKQWVFDRFADIGIDLEGLFTDLGTALDLSLDALGIDMENIRRDLGLEIHAGLEDAGDALSTIAGSLSAAAGGMLDAAMDAVSPLVEGLTLGFMGLIEGFKEMLDIDIEAILDAQDELRRRAVARQLSEVVPLEEAT